MIANIERESLDDAFRRVRDLDVSLREQLRTFAETVRRDRPEFAAAVDRLVTRLRQYGAGESAPQIGEPMPPFHLPDETGQMVSLEELLKQGPVAVTFHRGHWCPYCRININALVQAHKELTADAGQITAIMPDKQKFVADLKLQSNVPFPILSDKDNGYALSLNLTIWVGAEIQHMMEGRLDLPTFQGNSSWMLPIPATFVVGRDGLIRARFIDPDYRKRIFLCDRKKVADLMHFHDRHSALAHLLGSIVSADPALTDTGHFTHIQASERMAVYVRTWCLDAAQSNSDLTHCHSWIVSNQ